MCDNVISVQDDFASVLESCLFRSFCVLPSREGVEKLKKCLRQRFQSTKDARSYVQWRRFRNARRFRGSSQVLQLGIKHWRFQRFPLRFLNQIYFQISFSYHVGHCFLRESAVLVARAVHGVDVCGCGCQGM